MRHPGTPHEAEMPGMNLTKPQLQRLWGLDDVTCNEVLGTLEAEHFLKRTQRDGYILAGEPSLK